MRIWHAAALALMGWYLMIPPMHKGPNGTIDFPEARAPIIQWQVVDSYDSADSCRAGSAAHLDKIKAFMAQTQSPTLTDAIKKAAILQEVQAQCIATNDPRLKP
jgi:hypothetical protein